MTNFDIIGTLRTYAAAKGWVFLAGDRPYQNYELSQSSLTKGKIVLGVDFQAKPEYVNGKIISISYTGIMRLGEKTELTGSAEASQDETFIQKYDARLFALMVLLGSTIGDIACTNELDVIGVDFPLTLNMFDEQVDFVGASLTFKQ